MNPELLQVIKEACEQALAGRETMTWLEAQIALGDFRSKLFPSDVSALIAERDALVAEVERQAGEIEHLKKEAIKG